MADLIVWPHKLLVPEECRPNIVPFSRSGGRSLGGLEPKVRTDLGFWTIDLINIPVNFKERRLTWNAIRQYLGGQAGLIAVPAWSRDVAPYASGEYEAPSFVTHSDGTTFSDGTSYQQAAISVQSVGETPIGATMIKLRIIQADESLVGVRFSFEHALYETGRALEVDGDVWTVSIWPTVRATIPDGADLEFDTPTCLCHLMEDRGMDGGVNSIEFEQRSVSFNEANDYWNQLALGLI